MNRYLPLLFLALTGCATLSRDECQTVDWEDLGLRDGQAGYSRGRLAQHREACQEYGIVPNQQAYNAGRTRGLIDYCALDNALREGLAGRRYQGVCPGPIDRDFRALNEAAYAVHEGRREMEAIADRIDNLERALRKDKVSDKRRGRVRDDIRDLDRELGRRRDDLRWKERDLDRLNAMLRDRGSP